MLYNFFNEPCHCCGSMVDLMRKENRGRLINLRASISAQIVSLTEVLSHDRLKKKTKMWEQLVELQKQLEDLPAIIHDTSQ